jgi:UDP-N-acetylmuramyl pentapeptide phosphotransferase/UDP-N-acetylglucosamine-1-phosphate transferase
MKKWCKNNWLYIIGAVVGAAAGFLYWNFVGCASGTCAITSKPVNSTLYGALMGSLFFGLFKREKKNSIVSAEKNNEHDEL